LPERNAGSIHPNDQSRSVRFPAAVTKNYAAQSTSSANPNVRPLSEPVHET
jgi:hypothetical protein